MVQHLPFPAYWITIFLKKIVKHKPSQNYGKNSKKIWPRDLFSKGQKNCTIYETNRITNHFHDQPGIGYPFLFAGHTTFPEYEKEYGQRSVASNRKEQ